MLKKLLLGLALSIALVAPTMSADPLALATSQTTIPEPPTYTLNLGVQSIDARMFRIIHELTKNVSARVTAIDTQDKSRMDDYYQELLETITEVGVAGVNCTTDFHYLYKIDLTQIADPVLPVENEAINSAVMYLYGSNIGLRLSQSTRRNDCLESSDADDLIAGVVKSQGWLNRFFTNNTPLDMPKSHPRRDIIEPTSVNIPQITR